MYVACCAVVVAGIWLMLKLLGVAQRRISFVAGPVPGHMTPSWTFLNRDCVLFRVLAYVAVGVVAVEVVASHGQPLTCSLGGDASSPRVRM